MSAKLLYLCTADVYSLDKELQIEVFQEFNLLVYDMVYYIVKNHASTEDIIQEAFMKAVKLKPRYIHMSKINAWLKSVTRNVALNYLRKNRKLRDELVNSGVYIVETKDDSPFSNVEQLVEDKLSGEALASMIRSLKAEYKQILELKYIHEFTYKEIVELTGMSEGAVRQRLARARRAARNILQGKEC